MSATHTARAWSCTVRLVVDDPATLHAAAQDLHALLARVDAAASRFRADSALSRANALAGRPTPVPKLLIELVAVALDAARNTGGAVDPTLGRVLHRLGYDRDIDDVAANGPAVAVEPRPRRSWRDVALHREAGLLTVPAGIALDLGATAKAWTADHAAATLARRYGCAVLVEIGGDVAVSGTRPGGWCVGVAEREGGDGESLLLHRGGIATSTTTLRAWRRGEERLHHILDPRTGRPASGPSRTATVAADSAVEANTASTAAIVLGDAAPAWLAGRGLAARLVGDDGRVHRTPRWPVPAGVVA